MEKLFYSLSQEDKAVIADHFVQTNYEGDLSDYLINDLKTQVIGIKRTMISKRWQSPTGVIIDIDVQELEKTEIKHADKQLQPDAHTGVICVYPAMLQGIHDWYRLQKYLDKKFSAPNKIDSFEMFVQEYVQGIVNELKIKSYTQTLEKEIQDSQNTPVKSDKI